MTGSLHKAHAQLRRLKNDSSILKDAYITAIPHHKSKVFFEYVDVPKLSCFRTSTPVDDEDSSCRSYQARSANEESKLGFNMCECGFEGVSVKIARRYIARLNASLAFENIVDHFLSSLSGRSI